jgi:hypothetical protein
LTDFGPLIANPRTLLLGAAAQLGIFMTMFVAVMSGVFTPGEGASIGIIGGADGPTSIFTANKLAPHLIGPIAVAAYTYMSLVPLIQPPIMKWLTTDAERKIRMQTLRHVGKLERIVFALVVMVVVILVVPPASALIAMLMLGNIMRESGVVDRLTKSAQNEIINITTIFLGTSVGLTMGAENFLKTTTLMIIVMGVIAFAVSTAVGCTARQADEQALAKQPDQSVDRLGRGFRCADGGTGLAGRRRAVRQAELPADARHGPERGRRDRYGGLCRLLHLAAGRLMIARLKSQNDGGPDNSSGPLCFCANVSRIRRLRRSTPAESLPGSFRRSDWRCLRSRARRAPSSSGQES